MSAAVPWRQAAAITLGAGAVLAGFYLLPAGSSLTPMDFLGDEHAVLQFCDPLNSRPLPVIAGRPAVTLALAPSSPSVPGGAVEAVFTLTTISGKPIGPGDLLPRGHPEVRIAITGPAGITVHPEGATPGRIPGQWMANFAPQGAGTYKMTATFTPAVTEKEITAAADFEAGAGGAPAR
jgi:hypothetical protein